MQKYIKTMLIMIIYLYETVSWMWSGAYCQNTVHVQNMSSWIHYKNAQVYLWMPPEGDWLPGEQQKHPNAGSMLGQRLRQWPSIDPTLGVRPACKRDISEVLHITDGGLIICIVARQC